MQIGHDLGQKVFAEFVGFVNRLNVFNDEQSTGLQPGEPKKDRLGHVLCHMRTVIHHDPERRCIGAFHLFCPNLVNPFHVVGIATVQPILIQQSLIPFLVDGRKVFKGPFPFLPRSVRQTRYLHAVCLGTREKIHVGFKAIAIVETNLKKLKGLRVIARILPQSGLIHAIVKVSPCAATLIGTTLPNTLLRILQTNGQMMMGRDLIRIMAFPNLEKAPLF
mmetsp:Transcript_1896/g.3341  ORF Transcript_1896/g.3341 Transcript_1896/m.3341 type:complete len:220 (-) Transcript_1896:338-997(-)